VFNIGTDRFGTMNETLDALCRHADTGATVRRLPAAPAGIAMRATARLGLAPFAPYHWLMYSKSMWFDLDHARDALGWTPRWSTDEMFAQSYDWFLEHRDATHDAAASRHRRSARQGILAMVKHLGRVLPRAEATR
jgi:nucleoside-diphosphate-sugar epimerase